jgi:UDP-N-acetyl-D-galactosamine dehydrogenase
MPKIIVTSRNPVKINSAAHGFKKMLDVDDCVLQDVSVSSGVPDQPRSCKETFSGAKNRVDNAKKEFPGADYYIGIEGGIEKTDDGLQSFAWVYVEDKDGLVGKARSATFFLCKQVEQLLDQGMELGDADDIVFKQENSKQKMGAVGLLTHGCSDREKYYTEAVMFALIPYANKEHYIEKEDQVPSDKVIGVIGLGYVGLPIALAFSKKIRTVAFDINQERVDMMKEGVDPSNELAKEDFEGADVNFTANPDDLSEANFYIVTVPTPIDSHNKPNLFALKSATELIAKNLKKGDTVVYESTVYPGCTQEDCLPILENISGLKLNEDFKIGYSPERINPGDKEHTLSRITKVISGSDSEAAEDIASTYEIVCKAGIHKAENIMTAEAAKIIENTQRDVNIALMNDLALIFNRKGIETHQVLEAANTKWNFLPFTPGLVGGHCIGVDPYYLTYMSEQLGYKPQVITAGRRINDAMPKYIADQTIEKIIMAKKAPAKSRVLVMGITFKEDVTDVRNSKAAEIVDRLRHFCVDVDVVDPHADPKETVEHYGIESKKEPSGKYDAIVIAVPHKEYLNLTQEYFDGISEADAAIMDIKSIYKKYWSL